MGVLMLFCRNHRDSTIVDRKLPLRVDRAVERITGAARGRYMGGRRVIGRRRCEVGIRM